MNRQAQVLPRAGRQLYEAALWWAENRSVAEAARWLEGMELAIESWKKDSDRFPLAPESAEFEFPLRQMNFGVSRRPTHRVFNSVRDDRVLVYAIRHLAQQDLTTDDLE